MGIRDRPISPSSPWQNGIAERLIGTLRGTRAIAHGHTLAGRQRRSGRSAATSRIPRSENVPRERNWVQRLPRHSRRVAERPPRNGRARLYEDDSRLAQCRDKRETGPVEHEGLPTADNFVLEITVLGDPEMTADASHLEPGALRDRERFPRLEANRRIKWNFHGRLPCMRTMH